MKSYPFVRTGLIVLTLIALLLTAAPQSARAAGLITVTSAADSVGSDGLCTLREAIANANNDAATYGDCAAGSGADTITFAPALAGSVISLTTIGDTTLGPTALGITSNITILGDTNDGLTIERSGSAPDMRLFYVSAGGNLTLKYLTLQGGLARGFAGGTAFNGGTGGGAAGVGGAIFNRGSVTLDSVTLLNNQAIGGNGATWVDLENSCIRYGGGGGGVGSAGSTPCAPGYSAGGGPNGGSAATQNNATGPGGGGAGGNNNWGVAGHGGDFGGGGGGKLGDYGNSLPGGNGGFGGGGGGGSAHVYGTIDFAGGAAGYGGGAGGRGSVTSSPFVHGSGTGGGGGGLGGALFNDTGGNLLLINSTLTGNTARGGNGGDNVDGSNWLYSGSGGSGLGGGIFNRSAMLTLLNVTLANNAVIAGVAGSANDPGANGGRDGSEIYVYGSASVVNTTNSIAANNSSAYNHFVNDGGTVNGSHNLVMRASGVPAEVILSAADPLLEPLGDNGGATFTFALEAGSPAVNAGTGSGAPVLDQRGAGRDEMPDIGAYEVMGGSWLVDSAADTVANDGQTTLREAIQRANSPLGPHVIRFAPGLTGQTIAFSAAAGDGAFGPSAFRIDYAVTIDGGAVNGIVIRRDGAAADMRLFYVAPGGSLTLKNVTLSHGVARGGDGGSAMGGGGGGAAGLGGALFNQGTATLEGVTLIDNQAIGGNGVTGVYCSYGGGGGGGGGLGNSGDSTGGLNGAAGGGPNGGAGGQPGPQNAGAAGGVGGGGGGGMSWWLGGADYQGFDGGAGGFGGAGGGGGCGTAFYQKGDGGAGGFGGGAGGNSPGDYTWVSGGFGGGSNNTLSTGGGGAGMGGAVFNHGGTLFITNSTLSSNTAQGGAGATSGSGMGGAIFNRAGSVTMLNSTLAFNTLAGSGTKEGGALYSYTDGGAAVVNVSNSILAHSTGGSDAVSTGGTVSGSHNVIMNGSGFGSVTLSSSSPNLAALADNGGPTFTHAIVPPSVALHSGTAVGAPTTDQRGIPRDTRPDIGAFELQATVTFADPAGVCDGNIPCFTTMGGAIGAALSGGAAYIYGGTYDESVVLNQAITVTLISGDVILNGSLTIGAGVFNAAGSAMLIVEGDLTQSGGVFTTPAGELVIEGNSARTGGTVNYTANGSIQETRNVSGLDTLNFPFCEVSVNVTSAGFTSFLVMRHEQEHPEATRMTGKYWTIAPTGSGAATLTLPQPDLSDPMVCKYTGGSGYGWECDRSGFNSAAVWRDNISAFPEFSDWAVGNQVGPTAVSLSSFAATVQAGWVGLLAGWLVLVGGTATAVLRRKNSLGTRIK